MRLTVEGKDNIDLAIEDDLKELEEMKFNEENNIHKQ